VYVVDVGAAAAGRGLTPMVSAPKVPS